MKHILKKFLSTILALNLLTYIVGGFKIDNGLSGLFASALIISILFFIAKPIVNLLMLPINLLTLNLSQWIINIVIFYICTIIATDIKISTWHFKGLIFAGIRISSYNFASWQTIIITSIILTILLQFIDWIKK